MLSNKEIGQRINLRRIELNLTLQDVANTIGVASSTIQRYEAGNVNKLKLPVVESIAKALSVNPDWIVGKVCFELDTAMQNIDELLRESRKDKQELTEFLGFKSSSVYSDWLAGRNSSYKKRLKEIAEFFDVSLDYITGKGNVVKEVKIMTNERAKEILSKQLELLAEKSCTDDYSASSNITAYTSAMLAIAEFLQKN